MPSAQHVEVDEPSQRPVSAELHSLLSEVHVSGLNSIHGRGKVLFAEGETARGVYILRAGRAALSISSSEGRIITLRMAQAGDVLGLNAVLRGVTYDVTVKTLEPCRTNFVSRAQLFELIRTNQAGAQAVLKILSHELTKLTERTRALLLPQTASARFAKLLLEWSDQGGRINRVFTHEDFAQMICSSRETVTRLLASMSRRNIVRITSDSFVICDRVALEKMALS